MKAGGVGWGGDDDKRRRPFERASDRGDMVGCCRRQQCIFFSLFSSPGKNHRGSGFRAGNPAVQAVCRWRQSFNSLLGVTFTHTWQRRVCGDTNTKGKRTFKSPSTPPSQTLRCVIRSPISTESHPKKGRDRVIAIPKLLRNERAAATPTTRERDPKPPHSRSSQLFSLHERTYLACLERRWCRRRDGGPCTPSPPFPSSPATAPAAVPSGLSSSARRTRCGEHSPQTSSPHIRQ